jgi:gas vesicle protein
MHLWEYYKHKKRGGIQMNTFYRGVTTGLIVGTAATLVLLPMSSRTTRVMRRNTGKAIKAVGGLIDNIQSAFS